MVLGWVHGQMFSVGQGSSLLILLAPRRFFCR